MKIADFVANEEIKRATLSTILQAEKDQLQELILSVIAKHIHDSYDIDKDEAKQVISVVSMEHKNDKYLCTIGFSVTGHNYLEGSYIVSLETNRCIAANKHPLAVNAGDCFCIHVAVEDSSYIYEFAKYFDDSLIASKIV